MQDGPIWEEMAPVHAATVPDWIRSNADVAFDRAGVNPEPEQIEWRQQGHFFAAKFGTLFTADDADQRRILSDNPSDILREGEEIIWPPQYATEPGRL